MYAIAGLLNQHTTADFVTPALQGERTLYEYDFSAKLKCLLAYTV